MASSNAVGSAREFISPSDLTFSWGSCHKCLWLNYNHGLRTPGFMPLVGDLANMQENYFAAKTTADIAPVLPAGKVADLGGWVKSSFIDVNGSPTKYAIRGKYDLLIEFADSTFGIIDCKFQAKDSDKTDLYQPQLEAYAFALENPAAGPAKKVSLMGLLVWSLLEPAGDVTKGFGIKLKHTWRPIARNPEALSQRLTDFITVVSGAMPAAKDNCDMCKYITTRREFIGAE
jgi:hypothetical protein